MENVKTLILDLETSGLVKKIDVPGKRKNTTRKEQIPYETMYDQYPRIVSIAWKINDEETTHLIINQEGHRIPQEAIDIHGITDAMAAESNVTIDLALIQLLIEADGAEIVVGHNIYFDTSIIKANALRCYHADKLGAGNLEDLTHLLHKDKRIDTVRRTMKMMGGMATLQALHMKIFHEGFEAHNAREDVEALHRCYKWLLRKGIVPTLAELKQKAAEKKEKI